MEPAQPENDEAD